MTPYISDSPSDCMGLAHCCSQQEEEKISRAYLSLNPEQQQGNSNDNNHHKSHHKYVALGTELDQVLMEVKSTKDELERGGTFLDKKVNTCLEDLKSVEKEVLEQEIQSTKHELRAVSVQLNEKLDVCLQQLEGFVTK